MLCHDCQSLPSLTWYQMMLLAEVKVDLSNLIHVRFRAPFQSLFSSRRWENPKVCGGKILSFLYQNQPHLYVKLFQIGNYCNLTDIHTVSFYTLLLFRINIQHYVSKSLYTNITAYIINYYCQNQADSPYTMVTMETGMTRSPRSISATASDMRK